jgi:hypothetical protein
MELIEREAGLKGKILRPLSAKLLAETELEQNGIVDREELKDIQGRRRLPQFALAQEIGVYDYPCPSGGCLLTDPHFSKRLKDYLDHEGYPNVMDMILLRLGRHFRINNSRVVVGRNEQENRALEGLAEKHGWGTLSVNNYMGPTTVLIDSDEEILSKAAAITVRYSDAPKEGLIKLTLKHKEHRTLKQESMDVEEIKVYRI